MGEDGERREGPDGDDGRRSTGAQMGAYLGLGLQFALAILLSVYLGQWLDRRFGTHWILLLCVALGAGGAFYSIYRKLMADLRRDEERRGR
jgi:F0F1-type ATP synthase assembly protein I